MSRQPTREEILAVMREALKTVAPATGAIEAGTVLYGAGAIMDSVELVTLLVTLEQSLGSGLDLSAPFMDNADTPEDAHPFRSVGSLADLLHGLLAKVPS